MKKKVENIEEEGTEKPKTKRESKEFLDGEIVRVRKGLPRTNKPVELPQNPTWIKQSNLITLMSYDYTTIQLRVLIALLDKLQSAIDDSIRKVPFELMLPFKEFQNNDRVCIAVNFSDLGVGADQYGEVKTALKKLATIPVELDTVDPITGADSWAVTGLFKAYIPKQKFSKQFTLEIDKEVAKSLVNVDRGFTRFMKEIAFSTNSKYTIRLYMLISSWKDKGGFSITVDKFRKWLKLENSYPDFKNVYQRIIRPVYEELFEKSNCWFEVSEIYREGDKQPYKLNFKVIKSALSKKEEEQLNTQRKMIGGMLSTHFKMNEGQIAQITELMTLGNASNVMYRMQVVKEYVDKNWKSITNIPEYCLASILKEVKDVPGIIGDDETTEEG